MKALAEAYCKYKMLTNADHKNYADEVLQGMPNSNCEALAVWMWTSARKTLTLTLAIALTLTLTLALNPTPNLILALIRSAAKTPDVDIELCSMINEALRVDFGDSVLPHPTVTPYFPTRTLILILPLTRTLTESN